MAAVSLYARLALAVLTALFMLAVVVEFLTAGFGLFGATSLDLHEDLGFSVTLGLAILVLLGVSRRPDRAHRARTRISDRSVDSHPGRPPDER